MWHYGLKYQHKAQCATENIKSKPLSLIWSMRSFARASWRCEVASLGSEELQLMEKEARNNYWSMAELGSKVSGQTRESFGLCVSLTFLGKGTQTAVKIPPSAHELSLIGWTHESSPVFKIRRPARTKLETRSTTFNVLVMFPRKRSKSKN